jgi:hypothetical protein
MLPSRVTFLKLIEGWSESKVVSVLAMKIYLKGGRGCICIAPLFLNFGARWRWMVSFMPWPLYPQGNCLWLNRRFGGRQSWSGHLEEKRTALSLPGVKPQFLCFRDCKLATVPATMSQLPLEIHVAPLCCKIFGYHYIRIHTDNH